MPTINKIRIKEIKEEIISNNINIYWYIRYDFNTKEFSIIKKPKQRYRNGKRKCFDIMPHIRVNIMLNETIDSIYQSLIKFYYNRYIPKLKKCSICQQSTKDTKDAICCLLTEEKKDN